MIQEKINSGKQLSQEEIKKSIEDDVLKLNQIADLNEEETGTDSYD